MKESKWEGSSIKFHQAVRAVLGKKMYFLSCMSPIQNAHCVRKQKENILNYFLTEIVATGATLDAPDALKQAKLFWTNLFLINISYKILSMQAQKPFLSVFWFSRTGRTQKKNICGLLRVAGMQMVWELFKSDFSVGVSGEWNSSQICWFSWVDCLLFKA